MITNAAIAEKSVTGVRKAAMLMVRCDQSLSSRVRPLHPGLEASPTAMPTRARVTDHSLPKAVKAPIPMVGEGSPVGVGPRPPDQQRLPTVILLDSRKRSEQNVWLRGSVSTVVGQAISLGIALIEWWLNRQGINHQVLRPST